MSFRQLDHSKRREPLTVPTVSVFGQYNQTSFSIPRDVLRMVGFPDTVGSRFIVGVGEGADAGKVAIVPGEGVTSGKVGTADEYKALTIRSCQIGKARYAAKPVIAVEAKDGALILTLPADFPWEAPKAEAPTMERSIFRANGLRAA